MVAEIENSRLVSHARRRLASVDFPAPEGDDKITRRPRRFNGLLHVLNLFTHLIDDGFHCKPRLRQVRISCL